MKSSGALYYLKRKRGRPRTLDGPEDDNNFSPRISSVQGKRCFISSLQGLQKNTPVIWKFDLNNISYQYHQLEGSSDLNFLLSKNGCPFFGGGGGIVFVTFYS